MLEYIVLSFQGNALINVGPTANGTIIPVFRLLLKQLGEWLAVNGEAIYDTMPCFKQNDKINLDVWYTCNKYKHNATEFIPSQTNVAVGYAIFLKWPKDNVLRITNMADHIKSANIRIAMLKAAGNVMTKVK